MGTPCKTNVISIICLSRCLNLSRQYFTYKVNLYLKIMVLSSITRYCRCLRYSVT